MSYILDALKKSEREKTLGQVPTLETVVVDGAKRQPKGAPWWMNLLALLFILLAVLTVMHFGGLINVSSNKKTLATVTPSANEITENQTGQQTETAALSTPQSVSQPIQSQVPVEIEQDNKSQQSYPQLTNASESGQAEPVIQQSQPQPITSAQSAEQQAELEEIAMAQQQALAQQQVQESVAVQSPDQQVAAGGSNDSIYEEVLHQNLRSVTVNVVSYSSDARQRFVMLDLTIYKEGDSLPNGADIVEIMRTGAIVEFQNKRYLLKP